MTCAYCHQPMTPQRPVRGRGQPNPKRFCSDRHRYLAWVRNNYGTVKAAKSE